MIPILYKENEKDFLTNGLGRLSDAITCIVTEERNGQYELEMTYPVTGIHYDDLHEERIIFAEPADGTDNQPFRIYSISKPLDGIVTVRANHISYMLRKMTVMPFKADSPVMAMELIEENITGEKIFTFWTDKTTAGSIDLKEPVAARTLLGGTEGSLLDAFGGGEYEFDIFAVKLHEKRGHDNGVTIRHGKNLTGLESDTDVSDTYTAVIPYWRGDEDIVIGSKIKSAHVDLYAYEKCVPLDLSSEFEEKPTKKQLEDKAAAYMERNEVWKPKISTDISFYPLWQTQEYKDVATLERVHLCDYVTVTYKDLGIDVKAKVIKTVYDVLAGRYNEIGLGDARTTFADKVNSETVEKFEKQIEKQANWFEQAINDATNLIKGGFGGNIVIITNEQGRPEELCIIDTEDLNTAKNVWRWNKGGFGHSSTGYNGSYGTAITMDGKIIADYILAGTMLANRIKGGTLTLGGEDNGNGLLKVLNAKGEEIGYWGYDGIHLYQGSIEGPSIRVGGSQNKFGVFEALNKEDRVSLRISENTLLFLDDSKNEKIYRGQIKGSANGMELSVVDQSEEIAYIYSVQMRSDGSFYVGAMDIQLGETLGKVQMPREIYSRGMGQSTSGWGATFVTDSKDPANYQLYRGVSSSERYKDIDRKMTSEDIEQLYNIEPVWAKYKKGYLQTTDERCGVLHPMFVAEDVEKYAPLAVDHNADGSAENWNYRVMLPYMFKMITEQKKELDALKKKME